MANRKSTCTRSFSRVRAPEEKACAGLAGAGWLPRGPRTRANTLSREMWNSKLARPGPLPVERRQRRRSRQAGLAALEVGQRFVQQPDVGTQQGNHLLAVYAQADLVPVRAEQLLELRGRGGVLGGELDGHHVDPAAGPRLRLADEGEGRFHEPGQVLRQEVLGAGQRPSESRPAAAGPAGKPPGRER